MNYDERTMAAYLTDMMDSKVAVEATARAAGLSAEEAARVAALAAKAEIVLGQYQGNGVYPRDIDLGFQPKAVLLFSFQGQTNPSLPMGGLMMPGHSIYWVSLPNKLVAEVTENGFRIATLPYESNSYGANHSSMQFYYMVVK